MGSFVFFWVPAQGSNGTNKPSDRPLLAYCDFLVAAMPSRGHSKRCGAQSTRGQLRRELPVNRPPVRHRGASEGQFGPRVILRTNLAMTPRCPHGTSSIRSPSSGWWSIGDREDQSKLPIVIAAFDVGVKVGAFGICLHKFLTNPFINAVIYVRLSGFHKSDVKLLVRQDRNRLPLHSMSRQSAFQASAGSSPPFPLSSIAADVD